MRLSFSGKLAGRKPGEAAERAEQKQISWCDVFKVFLKAYPLSPKMMTFSSVLFLEAMLNTCS